MRRVRLEIKWFIAVLVLTIYSVLAVVPSLVFPRLWRWQNQLADWVERWALVPLYRETHR